MAYSEKEHTGRLPGIRRRVLILIDLVVMASIEFFMLGIYPSGTMRLAPSVLIWHALISLACVFAFRLVGGVYRQIWRYVNSVMYFELIALDGCAGLSYYLLQKLLFERTQALAFVRVVGLFSLNVLATVLIRLAYQALYEYRGANPVIAWLRRMTSPLTHFSSAVPDRRGGHGRRINIAIVGAGRVGVGLADDLLANPKAAYTPVCFIDTDSEKAGRNIKGIPVLREADATPQRLASYTVQEIVFALPKMEPERKRLLYEAYEKTGCKIKVYDYPVTQAMEKGKRHLREFDIEELLFRDAKEFTDDRTRRYYSGKVVMITGGGGSIGSELARQIARMKPKKLVILDVYENCAYDLQQELRIAYGDQLDLAVEILTITDAAEMDRVFSTYRPDVVLHAAAHKHVPLMEHNCVEAVKNNVFGTWNVVECCERYGVEKAVMVSTDKAVNPTNVMGATKRMCEMIFQSRVDSKTSFSCTRFGNVLGSNGSVIPLFRRQIANGGPVTLTDKRIIRYFMTIPEASQLVLNSGAMAKHGDLFVLDMGKPVKILELAENMIRLSGFEPYKDIDIIEMGLRPGEKLYEELLIKTEELDKTDNSMIFIERDMPLKRHEIADKLALLEKAVATMDDDEVRRAMKKVVPTFHSPSDVNAKAEEAVEMRTVNDPKGIAV